MTTKFFSLTNSVLILLPIVITLLIFVFFVNTIEGPVCDRVEAHENVLSILGAEIWLQTDKSACIQPLYFLSVIGIIGLHQYLIETLLIGILLTLVMTTIVVRRYHQLQVQNLEEELQATHQRTLSESRRGFEMLLKGLDHELGNIFTAINLGVSDNGQIEETSILTENMKRRLEKIRTIKDDLSLVLDANTLDSKQLQRLNVYELIDMAVQDEKGQTELDIRLLPALHAEEIAGHNNLLTYAFSNLIRNAIRYGRTQVDVRIMRGKGGVEIRVEDDGIGIPKVDQEKIFDPEYRATNVDPQSGTGIGLWLARAIILKHNGQVWLEESIENQGSIFKVFLPHYNSQDDQK